MPEVDVCGGTKRDGSGDPCQLPAGWGTDHTGEGRCKHHDGGGAPKGNDNATTHGGYKRVYEDSLTDDNAALIADDATLQDYIQEQITFFRVRMQEVQRKIQDNGELWPEAENALSALGREIRQLLKLRASLDENREQNQEKIDQLLSRFDQLRDRHTTG